MAAFNLSSSVAFKKLDLEYYLRSYKIFGDCYKPALAKRLIAGGVISYGCAVGAHFGANAFFGELAQGDRAHASALPTAAPLRAAAIPA